jgi:hypothetical protein
MDRELKARFEQHPYGALAVALGAGYLLGGGFFTPLTERMAKFALRVGIRVALVPFLAAQLSELVRPAENKDGAQTASPPQGDAHATDVAA